MTTTALRSRNLSLLGSVVVASDGEIMVRQTGRDFCVESGGASSTEVVGLLRRMERGSALSEQEIESFSPLLDGLARYGLLDTSQVPDGLTGTEALLELEDLANELLYNTLYQNVFWRSIQSHNSELPVNALYGFAVENYHFLFRESWFDSPALSFPGSTPARLLMNQFYGEEYGHDELILKGLNAIGISREELADTIPLPETLALCNALAFWARHDPIFFFSTLGVLEGKDIQQDSYLAACERVGLNPDFVKPLRAHSNLNINGEHGSLSRLIFREIDYIDRKAIARMRRQTRLFIEMYDAFYASVWNYYSTSRVLLNRVSSY